MTLNLQQINHKSNDMATRDDILNNPPKGTKEWSENNDNEERNYQKGTKEAVVQSAENAPDNSYIWKEKEPQQKDNPQNEQIEKNQERRTLSYKEMFEIFNPKPNPEQLKKDAKRARTRNIISALGDGISALANLHYTTKGAPNMYDGKNNLSEKSQARYDKLMQDYMDNLEKYRQGRLKAEQMDREWDFRQQQADRAQDNADKAHQLNKDKIEYDKEKDEKDFNEKKRQFDANLQRLKQQADDELAERKRVNNSTINKNSYYINGGGNSKKDKPEYMPFTSSDRNTNVLSIRKDVWQSNWPYLFGIIISEGYDMNDYLTKHVFDNMDDKQKETFVKQHWGDSETAKDYMKRMSEIYPNEEFNKTYNSKNDADSNIINYTPGGNNDEIIDYVPKSN